MSQRLLSSICPRLWECDSITETGNTDADLTTCIAHVTQRACTSSKQVSMDEYVFAYLTIQAIKEVPVAEL